MNLLMLFASDFPGHEVRAQAEITLNDRRYQHIRDILKASPGDCLQAGVLDGLMGSALITALDDKHVSLQVSLDQAPPPALPLSLILALPRPKMLRRILQTVATMGVKELVLINSFRVEKSYWQTPFLQPDSIREQFLLGLEQGCDTILPKVEMIKRFKPFVEDSLPTRASGSKALVAHPGPYPECPRQQEGHVWLAIGPEGGFIPYEIDKLTAAGFQPVQLGARILRVETAVTALLSRLF